MTTNIKVINIDGRKVYYDAEHSGGMDYLMRHLDRKETKVFFDEAKRKGKANFEDGMGKNYTLDRNGDGTYTIVKRSF